MTSSNDVINLSIFYDVIEVEKISKIFFEEFFFIPEIKKKIMRIGLLEKKVRGGVKLPPPLPCNR